MNFPIVSVVGIREGSFFRVEGVEWFDCYLQIRYMSVWSCICICNIFKNSIWQNLPLFYVSGFSRFKIFEGDMQLPMEQIQAAEHGLDPTVSGGARGLKRRAQWPGGIVPYTIHSSASMIQDLNLVNFFYHHRRDFNGAIYCSFCLSHIYHIRILGFAM